MDNRAESDYVTELETEYHIALKELAEITAERDRLREALECIAEYGGHLTGEDAQEMKQIAQKALAESGR